MIYDGYMWSYETDKINEATAERKIEKLVFPPQRDGSISVGPMCVETPEMEPRNASRYMWERCNDAKKVLRAL